MPSSLANKLRIFFALAICVGGSALASANPGVVVREIDFLGNRTATDRHFYYDESSDPPAPNGTYPPIEVPEAPGPIIDKIVYLRGQDLTVKIKVKSTVGATMVGTLFLETPLIDFPAGLYAYRPPFTLPLSASGGQVVTLTPGGTATATFTLSGAPNYVAHGKLKFTPKFVCITPFPGYEPMSPEVQEFTTYLIDSGSVGLQAAPWTDVLDHSCELAFYGVGSYDVTEKLCERLYQSGRFFRYNLNVVGVTASYFTDLRRYHLRTLLVDLAVVPEPGSPPGPVLGNCQDVSGFLEVLSTSQGVAGAQRQFLAKLDVPNEVGHMDWVTNPVAPIGYWSPYFEYYVNLRFSMHQVFVQGAATYDGALAYYQNLSGFIFRSPAVAWSFNGFWQTFHQNSVFGNAFRAHLPNHDITLGSTPLIPFPHILVSPSYGHSDIDYDIWFEQPLQGYEY